MSETDIFALMEALPGWSTDGARLTRTFEFNSFLEAVDFVHTISKPAEKAGHSPDITISSNLVTISLSTYDMGEFTDKDIDLVEAIVNSYGKDHK